MDGQYPTAHIVTAFNMGFRFRTAADAAKIKGMPKPLAEPAAEEIRRVAFGYRSALGMDPRSFNRLGGNRVRNRQVAMFYRTTGLDLTHPGSPAKAMALEDIRVPRDRGSSFAANAPIWATACLASFSNSSKARIASRLTKAPAGWNSRNRSPVRTIR